MWACWAGLVQGPETLGGVRDFGVVIMRAEWLRVRIPAPAPPRLIGDSPYFGPCLARFEHDQKCPPYQIPRT